MATEIYALLGVVGGALLTMIGSWFKSYFSSSTDNKISLRESTLKRITQLETRQYKLETKVNVWTGRYWALYRWIVKFCMVRDLEILPPSFHDMERAEINETVNKMYQEHDQNPDPNETE